MSGIYIPDMELPKTCEDCWFYGTDTLANSCCYLLGGKVIRSMDSLPQDCPLVLVPDHARFIEAIMPEPTIEEKRCTNCRFFVMIPTFRGKDEPWCKITGKWVGKTIACTMWEAKKNE